MVLFRDLEGDHGADRGGIGKKFRFRTILMQSEAKKIKKTKNQQAQDTERLILNQAMRLFLEKGYHGTSINDITQAVGLTKGAIYWHFKSKENLLRRVMEEYETRFLDGLIRAVGEVDGKAFDKFEKFNRYNAAFGYYNRDLCVSFTTLAAELFGTGHGVESEIRRIYGKYQKFIAKMIAEGKKEKVFRKDLNPALTALLIMALHDGMLLQWSMNRDKVDGGAFVKTSRKVLFNGILSFEKEWEH
jgi:AcrR family transcriptional regulator